MTVDELFAHLERKRTEILSLKTLTLVPIMADGLPVDLLFENPEQVTLAKPFMSGLPRTTPDTADIKILFFQDNPISYVDGPGKSGQDIWNFRGQGRIATIKAEGGLVAADFNTNTFYACVSNIDNKAADYYGSILTISLMLVFRLYGRYIIHSACFGYNDLGALFVARSGGGKSTLAVSTLLGDFQFVADDYTVVEKRDDDLIASPLFRTVGLNQDMFNILKPDMPVARINHYRDNKLYLDASAYKFHPELKIKCMIVPKIVPGCKPHIERTQIGRTLIPCVHSTVDQLMFPNDKNLVRELSTLFGSLPAYEFSLGTDLFENREYLRNWFSEYK